jgi:hypothetical protein
MSAAITRNSSLVGPEGCRGRARIGYMVHPAHPPYRVQGLMRRCDGNAHDVRGLARIGEERATDISMKPDVDSRRVVGPEKQAQDAS